MKKEHILSLALLAAPLFAADFKPECSIIPTPQKVELSNKYVKPTSVKVSMRKADTKGKIWDKLPNVEGGYALEIKADGIRVYANDEAGVFYAKQSLTQLAKGANLYAQKDLNAAKLEDAVKGLELPVGTIIDWPDLAYRGSVEGYYGSPWTHEARKAQFEFYGRNKMNTYIWAPKDDPYHHGAKCRDPYPEETAKQIKELCEVAKKNHVKFVWAIHPNNTVRWANNEGKDDLDALCKKLELMYDLGVRHFGVFVDDSGGEINEARYQVKLCSYINDHFIKKHKDVGDIIMCPTGYNKAWASENYLRELGSDMPNEISIMWTGNTVVHDITLEGQQWVNERVNRPTFIWWNWPCNDFMRSNVCLGRTYGLDQDPAMLKAMRGFVSNPMEYPEASKTGLFGVADYTWNIRGFNSDYNWKEGMTRLYPKTAKEMQLFANHNSDLGPNNHGYRREESVDIAPMAQALREALSTGKPNAAAAKAMKAEFTAIAKAGKVLMTHDETAKLRTEIDLWLKHFQLMGEAGVQSMSYLEEKGKLDSLLTLIDTQEAIAEVRRGEQFNVLTGKWDRKNAITGKKELAPLLINLTEAANAKGYAQLSGEKEVLATPRFTCHGGDASANAEKLFDGDDRSFWEKSGYQAEGDWYALDFGSPRLIRSIDLLMGGPRAEDYVGKGQLEYSVDGKNWTAIGEPTTTPRVTRDLSEKPVTARHLRYRVLEARPNWLTICSFDVNRTLPAQAKSDVEGWKNVATSRDGKLVRINRIMEVHSMKPGQSIEMILPNPVAATWLEVNFENDSIKDWADIQLTLADGSVVAANCYKQGHNLIAESGALPKQRIAGMKLTHKGTEPQEVKLNMFKLDCPPEDPSASKDSLIDSNLFSSYNIANGIDCALQVPQGAKTVRLVGRNIKGVELKAAGKALTAAKSEQQVRVISFSVPAGTSELQITAPATKDGAIHEVIFSSK